MNIVALDLKMQLGDIKLEIGKLRNEMKELMDEFRKGTRPIVVGNAVDFAVFVAMLVVGRNEATCNVAGDPCSCVSLECSFMLYLFVIGAKFKGCPIFCCN